MSGSVPRTVGRRGIDGAQDDSLELGELKDIGICAAEVCPCVEDEVARKAIVPKINGEQSLSWLPYVALALLALQNATAVLIMSYCRTIPSESLFLTQSAVIMGEVLKGLISMLLVLRDNGTLSGGGADKRELLRSGVPALLYLVQNNLQYLAVSNLEATTYQVTYQLKILSTALLSALLLGKRLGRQKWLALVLLTVGVVVVQVTQFSEVGTRSVPAHSVNLPLGVAYTLLATLSSGCAGVYFEKMLKDGSKLSVWQRNLQLAMYSVLIGFLGLASTGQVKSVIEKGFFQGYTPITWINVTVQGAGGLLIAIVIKYTDNIMKNIATSVSTVLCAFMSMIIFNTPLNVFFIFGAMMVNYAAYLYSR